MGVKVLSTDRIAMSHGLQREVLNPRPPVLVLSTLTTPLTITLLTRDPWIKVLDAHLFSRMVRRWGRSLSSRCARLHQRMSSLN